MTIPDEVDIIVAGGIHSLVATLYSMKTMTRSRWLRWMRRRGSSGCSRQEPDSVAGRRGREQPQQPMDPNVSLP